MLACTAPGTRYAFLFLLFSSSGGWVKIKLELPHFHVLYVSDTCRVSIHPTLPLQQQLALLVPGSWACRPGLIYQVCCTWNERLETGVRTTSTRIVQCCCCCCCTYIVVAHIPIYLLNFGGVACRIFFTSISSANSPKSWWEGNLVFYAEGKYIFKTYFRKHSTTRSMYIHTTYGIRYVVLYYYKLFAYCPFPGSLSVHRLSPRMDSDRFLPDFFFSFFFYILRRMGKNKA